MAAEKESEKERGRERGREGRRAIRQSSFNKISSSNIMADAGLTSQMDITITVCPYTPANLYSVNWAS